jgi:hypothetical protein
MWLSNWPFFTNNLLPSSKNNSVSIATRYGLGGQGIESRWGRDFPRLSTPALGPTQPSIQWVPALLWGKAAGTCRWPPTLSRAEVKERVELYIYAFLTYSGAEFISTFTSVAITLSYRTLFWRNLVAVSYQNTGVPNPLPPNTEITAVWD